MTTCRARSNRDFAGVDPGYATFGTLICSHLAGTKFYKLDSKTFTYAAKKGFFRTPGPPPRVEAKIPLVCVVAALVGRKPLRLWAAHGLSAAPPQRAFHARAAGTGAVVEGNELAFDIKAVAPNAGSDLTVVVQT